MHKAYLGLPNFVSADLLVGIKDDLLESVPLVGFRPSILVAEIVKEASFLMLVRPIVVSRSLFLPFPPLKVEPCKEP
jgi:hypothetical protein